MPVTDRDRRIQALYVMGEAGAKEAHVRLATALAEAARVILAERLRVQSVAQDPITDSIVLYCDDEEG